MGGSVPSESLLKPSFFKLLKEHYERVFYFPDTEYRFMNPFMTKRYFSFNSEEEFREELLKFKPLFIMNSVGDLLYLDFDFRLNKFTSKVLNSALRIVGKTLRLLEDMIEVEKYQVVFSGRGFHLYVQTPHIDRVMEVYSKIGFAMTSDFTSTFNRTIVYTLTRMDKSLMKYLDPSSGASGKMARTPMSINNKNFLPVVPVEIESNLSLLDIINVIREPLKFKVELRRKLPVRIGEVYEFCDDCVVDEYELMRLLINYNLIVKRVKELS